MTLSLIEKLAPPDAQLLMALKPYVVGEMQKIVDRLIAENRAGKVSTERLWAALGALTALQDLEFVFRRRLIGYEKEEPIA